MNKHEKKLREIEQRANVDENGGIFIIYKHRETGEILNPERYEQMLKAKKPCVVWADEIDMKL